MDVIQAITNRRSIRKYQRTEVSEKLVLKILLAARHAPSAGNIQNWKVIVVTNEHTRSEISKIANEQVWMEQAPIHIVICSDQKVAADFYGPRGERLYSIQNCAAYAQNIVLAATEYGLGTCWISSFDEERLKGLLSIPDHIRPQSIITLGFSDEVVPQVPQKDPKEYISHESYGKTLTKMVALQEMTDFGKDNVERVHKLKEFAHHVKKKLLGK